MDLGVVRAGQGKDGGEGEVQKMLIRVIISRSRILAILLGAFLGYSLVCGIVFEQWSFGVFWLHKQCLNDNEFEFGKFINS